MPFAAGSLYALRVGLGTNYGQGREFGFAQWVALPNTPNLDVEKAGLAAGITGYYRSEDLQRDARDHAIRRGQALLERAGQQRGGRARVLRGLVPRAARVLGRLEAAAAQRYEVSTHDWRRSSSWSIFECMAPIRSRSGSRPERMISTAASGSTSPDRRSTSTRTSSSTSGCRASR